MRAREDTVCSHRTVRDWAVLRKKPGLSPTAAPSVDGRINGSPPPAPLPGHSPVCRRPAAAPWDAGGRCGTSGSDSAGPWPLLSSPGRPSSSHGPRATTPRPLQPGRGRCADRPGEAAQPHPLAITCTRTLPSTSGSCPRIHLSPLRLVASPSGHCGEKEAGRAVTMYQWPHPTGE